MLTQVTKAREQADQVDHSANEKKKETIWSCIDFLNVYIFLTNEKIIQCSQFAAKIKNKEQPTF